MGQYGFRPGGYSGSVVTSTPVREKVVYGSDGSKQVVSVSNPVSTPTSPYSGSGTYGFKVGR